ncbi:MAG: hypothetical protein ACI8WB_004801, partial [Phenylobacterium sp.]
WSIKPPHSLPHADNELPASSNIPRVFVMLFIIVVIP